MPDAPTSPHPRRASRPSCARRASGPRGSRRLDAVDGTAFQLPTLIVPRAPVNRHPCGREVSGAARAGYNRGMNALCILIDGWHAGFLGPYGNSWIETPALNRLAAESLVFDCALAQSPRLDDLYAACWQGWHALCPPPPADRPTLGRLLAAAGVELEWLTDEPRLADHPAARELGEPAVVEPPWQAEPVREIEQTHAARCFMSLIDRLESLAEPYLFWCHLAGPARIWDAPMALRESFGEPGDPPTYDGADVPERILPKDYDPDVLLPLVHAYAAQMVVLDTCLGALLEYLDDVPPGSRPLLIVAGARGFALGEHRRVGPSNEALYGELVHVPLLVRTPDGSTAAARSAALVDHADLWATLLDWWRIADRPAAPTAAGLFRALEQEDWTPRDRLVLRGRGAERAIRTPAWYLRRAETAELYVKPDDRWEANDVSVRCREVAECLEDALAQMEIALRAGSAADLPPLSRVLIEGLG